MLNQPAPEFSLIDQSGVNRSLSDYRGHWVVLYFYPKDGSQLCTTEACNFRDEQAVIGQFGNAEILGISMDSPESHQQFAKDNSLDFGLLSDPEHRVIAAYGCWQPENTPNREYLGVLRSTFLISPEGRIAKEYRHVMPDDHAIEIISDLQHLQQTS